MYVCTPNWDQDVFVAIFLILLWYVNKADGAYKYVTHEGSTQST